MKDEGGAEGGGEGGAEGGGGGGGGGGGEGGALRELLRESTPSEEARQALQRQTEAEVAAAAAAVHAAASQPTEYMWQGRRVAVHTLSNRAARPYSLALRLASPGQCTALGAHDLEQPGRRALRAACACQGARRGGEPARQRVDLRLHR